MGKGQKEVFVNPSDVVITSHYNDDDAALITYIEVIVEQVSSSDQYQIFVEYCNFSESVRGIPFVRVWLDHNEYFVNLGSLCFRILEY